MAAAAYEQAIKPIPLFDSSDELIEPDGAEVKKRNVAYYYHADVGHFHYGEGLRTLGKSKNFNFLISRPTAPNETATPCGR